jgi:hypothetical protein
LAYFFPLVVMREEKTNPVGPGDELRNLSTKALRPRRGGCIVRRLAAFVLFAVVAIPGPPALAQPPARPEPQELWRQFPLEQAPPNTQAPESEPAPQGSSPTSPTTAEEGDGSFANARTVAIAVTVGLLLLLMVGVRASVSWAQVPLGREDVARRLRSVVATNGQRFGVASRARQRSLKRAAAQGLREMRRIAANVRNETVPASAEATRNELARLKEMLATYVARGPAERSADDHVDKLKAKLEVQPPTSGTEHPEVEILKAKRGEPAGSGDAAGLDEAAMLKAKLADNVAGKTRPRKAPGMGSKQRVSR